MDKPKWKDYFGKPEARKRYDSDMKIYNDSLSKISKPKAIKNEISKDPIKSKKEKSKPVEKPIEKISKVEEKKETKKDDTNKGVRKIKPLGIDKKQKYEMQMSITKDIFDRKKKKYDKLVSESK